MQLRLKRHSALTSRHFKTDKERRENFPGFCETGFWVENKGCAIVSLGTEELLY
jgi:hypothetical protein